MLISVSDFVGVSKSTAGRIVRDISFAIAHLLYDKYIYVHHRSAEKFYEIAEFPRVLGAIDCTHIRLQSPCTFSSLSTLFIYSFIGCNFLSNNIKNFRCIDRRGI